MFPQSRLKIHQPLVMKFSYQHKILVKWVNVITSPRHQQIFSQKLIVKNYAKMMYVIKLFLTHKSLRFSKFCCQPRQVRYFVDDKGWSFRYRLLISCRIPGTLISSEHIINIIFECVCWRIFGTPNALYHFSHRTKIIYLSMRYSA